LGERARILVVDDDESIRKTLTAILEDKGYSVDTAKNGKEAIRKSKAKFFHLALIDIKLPDLEGIELLTAMRDTTPKMIKIIIITGYSSLQSAIGAVNKSADAYLLKPFNMDTLLRTIKEHLQKQQKAKKYSEEKVTEFIEARVKEIEEAVPRKNTR